MRPDQVVDSYVAWLRQNITARDTGEWIEVTAPFLDRHNDYLQIYIQANGEDFVLKDDGATLNDLAVAGLEVSSTRDLDLLKSTLTGFGIELKNHELTARAKVHTLPWMQHALFQAMMAVNYIFTHQRSTRRSLAGQHLRKRCGTFCSETTLQLRQG